MLSQQRGIHEVCREVEGHFRVAFCICAPFNLQRMPAIRQTPSVFNQTVTCSLRYVIGGYMKLAVEAFAQNQESDTVHMEVVATPRTFT